MNKTTIRQLTTKDITLVELWATDDGVVVLECNDPYICLSTLVTCYVRRTKEDAIKIALPRYWHYVERIIGSHKYSTLTEEGK